MNEMSTTSPFACLDDFRHFHRTMTTPSPDPQRAQELPETRRRRGLARPFPRTALLRPLCQPQASAVHALLHAAALPVRRTCRHLHHRQRQTVDLPQPSCTKTSQVLRRAHGRLRIQRQGQGLRRQGMHFQEAVPEALQARVEAGHQHPTQHAQLSHAA